MCRIERQHCLFVRTAEFFLLTQNQKQDTKEIQLDTHAYWQRTLPVEVKLHSESQVATVSHATVVLSW